MGLVCPSCEIINIFDVRRAVCLSHYIYINRINLKEQDFIDALKQNENFNLNDEEYVKLSQDLIGKITDIKEIYRVTVELENLHI